jgi:hypothetical protein
MYKAMFLDHLPKGQKELHLLPPSAFTFSTTVPTRHSMLYCRNLQDEVTMAE